MNFAPVSANNLDAYENIFKECFPKASHLTRTYLDWLYFKNPQGNVVGFDALENGRVVAHYACIPASYMVGGKPSKGLLSLNTATAPSHQGKGLFTKLAQLTYENGAGEGCQFVVGIANSNSTPGFVRKLGFTLVSPLEAFAFSPMTQKSTSNREIFFSKNWTTTDLKWRLSNPTTNYQISGDRIIAKSSIPGLPIYTNPMQVYSESNVKKHTSLKALGMFIGFSTFSSARIFVPSALKPSPLNFIYRSLNGEVKAIDKNSISLDFLDFDAY